jgi:hypothetical protein
VVFAMNSGSVEGYGIAKKKKKNPFGKCMHFKF